MIYPQKKPRRVKGVSLDKECMRLWGELVRIRAGHKCEKCGSEDRLQAHHIFTRSIARTRYAVNNGVCLCAGHHLFWAHKRPHEFRDYMTEKRGEQWWVLLRELSNIRGKVDLKLVKIYLQGELNGTR